MIIDEAKKAVEELKAQGNSDDEIIAAFYYGYKDGKINIAEFEVLMQLLGYTLSEEFLRGDENGEQPTYEEEKPTEEPTEEPEQEEEEEPKEESEEDKALKLFGK